VLIVTSSDRCTQARAILQKELFQEYVFEQRTSVMFSVNLITLVDCLQIFGSSSECTTATMTYAVLLITFYICYMLFLPTMDIITHANTTFFD
jgi:hypothetical protein